MSGSKLDGTDSMASLITRLRGSSIAAPLYRRAFFLNFSSDVTDKFKNKEAAEERMYFNKEDEKLLRGLLSKMKAQAECSDRTHIDKER